MSLLVTFYVQNCRNRADSISAKLPPVTARHLLSMLAYRVPSLVELHKILPGELLAQIYSVRRQFALGRLREFTSAHVDAEQILVYLRELERVAHQAQKDSVHVMMIGADHGRR